MQNLWEDDNSTEADIRAAKPGARSARRIPTGSALLAMLRSWLLHDYIVPYCRSLAAARIFSRCYWIDGLGDVRNVSDTRKALPIFQEVTAAAQELAGESRSMAMRWLVLQPGRSSRVKAALVQAPGESVKTKQAKQAQEVQEAPGAPFVLPKQNSIINADWPTIAPNLLEALDQSAAFFLLNPLATSASASPASAKQEQQGTLFFAHSDLAPLYTRAAPTELCLLLSHAQVENRLLPALRTPAGAAAFTALLRSDRWKALLAQDHPVVGTRLIASSPANLSQPPGRDQARPYDGVIDLLQAAIQPHFLAVQRIAFPICSGPSVIEDAPYTLLFATRRQDSLCCMNDAICGYRRRLEEQSYQGLLNEAWFRERHQARLAGQMQALTGRILHAGRAHAPRRWPDLRQQLLLSSFGAYLLCEYDEIIGRLLENGDVRCEWRRAGQAGQQATGTGQGQRRIPGHDDVLQWQESKRHY
jgi:hypothetical protein